MALNQNDKRKQEMGKKVSLDNGPSKSTGKKSDDTSMDPEIMKNQNRKERQTVDRPISKYHTDRKSWTGNQNYCQRDRRQNDPAIHQIDEDALSPIGPTGQFLNPSIQHNCPC
jgi:hypothetical protein